eukprot:COSAG01_NODE_184_length_22692_cov_155.762758_10_plen_134_part_00
MLPQVDARRALVRAQAGEELTDEFAGKSADDVERHIMQMLAVTAVDEGVPPADRAQPAPVPSASAAVDEAPLDKTMEQTIARLKTNRREHQQEVARLLAKDEQRDREVARLTDEIEALRAAAAVGEGIAPASS